MYISEPEVQAVLTYEALIPAIRQALIDYSASSSGNQIVQPPRTILRAGNAEGALNGWFAVMPAIAGDVMGVKTVTFFPGNAASGLHAHLAVITLLRRSTGEPLAVLDGRLITEMRTAAVSAVALDALAPANVRSLGILGSGVQARAHIRALRLVRPALEEIRIWSRTPAHAASLAAELGDQADSVHAVSIHAVSIEEAASADVVLTVTSSPTPVLEGRWLAPRAVVLAVGAVGAELRELDDEAMLSSCVIAESRASLERESGDVRLSGARIHAEIGQILSGEVPAPGDLGPDLHPDQNSGQRIVFKSVGMAIEDLTAARLVWAAREATRR
jgi:thiomorpholine-carboxylate dehydrogenase